MSRTSDQTQAISRVWQLPPIESFRKWVSLEDRYGTCFLSFFDRPKITCMPQSKIIEVAIWVSRVLSSLVLAALTRVQLSGGKVVTVPKGRSTCV